MNKFYVLLKQRVITALLAIALLLALPTGWASASEGDVLLEWEQSYWSNVELLHVKPIRDGYAVIGVNKRNYNVYFAKTDSVGTLYWEKSFEVRSDNGKIVSFEKAVSTQDGGYLLGGTFGGVYFNDYYLLKLDENGLIQWSNTFNSGAFGKFSDIRSSKDGGFVFAEFIESTKSIFISNNVGKLSSTGDVILRKSLGAGGREGPHFYINKIHELENGSYIAEGHIEGTVRIWMLDSKGDVVWTNTYSGLTGGEVAANADGGYMIAAANVDDEVVFIKNDANNQEEQRKTLAVRGKVISLETIPDGFLFGTTQGLYKTNSNGDVLWFHVVNNLEQVIVESDGGVLVIAKESLLKFGTSDNHESPSLENLKFDSDEYSVNIGEPLDIAVTYRLGNHFTQVTNISSYSSSDPSIAYVDLEGNIIGLQRGRVTLTVTYDGLEATAIVDVY
ncbi:hypothetical protein ACE3MQ_15445 [Paenibacillus lentus]|uniref:hypothetical protein n=1 Tax=Paenibacillus lentus TaxID=1338368 RepID=UPI00366517D3